MTLGPDSYSHSDIAWLKFKLLSILGAAVPGLVLEGKAQRIE